MRSELESFALLEKRTIELGQRFQDVLEERNSLRQQVETLTLKLEELEAKAGNQSEVLNTIDTKVADLLEQIDSYLPQADLLDNQNSESQDVGNIQVLPGMHGS